MLSTHTNEILTSEIKRIETHQSIREKILRGGSITVDSGDDEIEITGIPKMKSVTNSIQNVSP
jgi:hypothetical protein